MHDARAMIVHRDGAYRTIRRYDPYGLRRAVRGHGLGDGRLRRGDTDGNRCCDGAYRKSVCVSGDVGWFLAVCVVWSAWLITSGFCIVSLGN